MKPPNNQPTNNPQTDHQPTKTPTFVSLQPLLQGNWHLYNSCAFYPSYSRLELSDEFSFS
jgi:hypothetical protein